MKVGGSLGSHTRILVNKPRPPKLRVSLEEADVGDTVPTLQRRAKADGREAGTDTRELAVAGAAAVCLVLDRHDVVILGWTLTALEGSRHLRGVSIQILTPLCGRPLEAGGGQLPEVDTVLGYTCDGLTAELA